MGRRERHARLTGVLSVGEHSPHPGPPGHDPYQVIFDIAQVVDDGPLKRVRLNVHARDITLAHSFVELLVVDAGPWVVGKIVTLSITDRPEDPPPEPRRRWWKRT